ncbi:response regulator [Pinibacter aurantiacus]|uniref:Response regulator transcription factor n=1 Tax=Pinibacter aurantiacus TaxID=2851599 RepID=A0A9E2SD09_9BACT|nr:response regulator transcription factor [Pinibacter aurantiacus]MBV4359122.1 response regulator transcription factor [Pinibacter aurantiacus]
MISLFIIDDHELYLEGLSLLLVRQPGIEIRGSARNGQGLLDQLPGLDVDILLLDVNLPDIEEELLLKKIREIKPDQKVIYLTLMRGTRYVHKLTKHKVQGYILKNASINELVEAITVVHNGGSHFSKDIDVLSNDDFRHTITIDDTKVEDILSKREIEVLKLVCKEYSNAEIAEKLYLSISTIETHRKNLISKLGVTNTVGLVKFAIKNKLID